MSDTSDEEYERRKRSQKLQSQRGNISPDKVFLGKEVQSSFDRYLQWECNIVYRIQRLRSKLPYPIRFMMDRLISSHPLYDISIIFWICLPFIIYYVGHSMVWIVSLNGFASFILSAVMKSSVPADKDPRLSPRGRVSPYGFPCIELFLYCSIMMVIFSNSPSIVVSLLTVLYFLGLLFSRIFALTHYPSQLVLSMLAGFVTVPSLLALGNHYFPKGLHIQMQVIGTTMIIFLVFGYICYLAETNEGPFLRIPRDEYVRVMGGIIYNVDNAQNAPDVQLNATNLRNRMAVNSRDVRRYFNDGRRLGEEDSTEESDGEELRSYIGHSRSPLIPSTGGISNRSGSSMKEEVVKDLLSSHRGSIAHEPDLSSMARRPPMGRQPPK